MEDLNELNNLCMELSQAIKLMATYGRKLAEAEKNYKISLRQEALKLRSGDMAVTLIDKVVYGVPEVADKRFKRDTAEAMYKTAQENINVLKVRIRVLENQIKLDWSKNE